MHTPKCKVVLFEGRYWVVSFCNVRMNKLAYLKQKRQLENNSNKSFQSSCQTLYLPDATQTSLLFGLFCIFCPYWVDVLHKEPPRFLCITFSLNHSTCQLHQPHLKSSKQSINNMFQQWWSLAEEASTQMILLSLLLFLSFVRTEWLIYNEMIMRKSENT